MDSFHKVMIRDGNPSATELPDIVEKRESKFVKRMNKVEVAPAISMWATRMKKNMKTRLGLDYCVYGHDPMPYETALMCCRYGMDPNQWPSVFEPADLERAIGWERGRVPGHVAFGERKYYPPIAGGSELTDYMEAQIGNSLFRTGITTLANWAASTAYSVGNQVQAATWNDTIFECVVAGTSGGTEPSFTTGIGTETTDNTVTWQATKIGLTKRAIFVALFTAAPGETGGGTEVSGGAYARVQHDPTDTNWTASTNAAGAGRNDNATAITFPTPTASWGTITDFALLSRATGGNYFMYSPLTTSKTVNNGDPAPNFPIGNLDIDFS